MTHSILALLAAAALACEPNRKAPTGAADGGDGGWATATERAAWSWGDSRISDETVAFVGYDQGCSEYGELEQSGDLISFRMGYRLTAPPADRLKHYGGNPTGPDADDGSLAGYSVAGAVLLIRAVQDLFDEGGDSVTRPLTPVQRVPLATATAAEVSIRGTLPKPGGNPCRAGDNRCLGRVEPTFVVVWQRAEPRARAYQFIRPALVVDRLLERPRYADCPTVPGQSGPNARHQSLGVYWPLREELTRRVAEAPEPTRWTAWIDEVLPR